MINRTFSTLTVLTNSIKRKFKEYLPPFFSFQVLGGGSKYGCLLSESPLIDRVAYDHDIKRVFSFSQPPKLLFLTILQLKCMKMEAIYFM